MPSKNGNDFWNRVPAIGVDPSPGNRSTDAGGRSPGADRPAPVLIDDRRMRRPRYDWLRDTGGVSISGSYNDGTFRLNANLSPAIADAAYRYWVGADGRFYYSPSAQVGWSDGQCGTNFGSGWGWLYGGEMYPSRYAQYWGYDPSWGRVRIGSTYSSSGTDPNLSVYYQPTSPPKTTSAPEPPPTPDEVARAAMSAGNYAEAVDAWKIHLKSNPTDPSAMRRLAVAMLLARRWDDGFVQMSRAYQTDPVLSDVPLTPDELGVRDDVLRELTGRVVTRARQGRSRDAWMTAAVLMQARGKNPQAITMLEGAKNAGMDATLHARMRQALSR